MQANGWRVQGKWTLARPRIGIPAHKRLLLRGSNTDGSSVFAIEIVVLPVPATSSACLSARRGKIAWRAFLLARSPVCSFSEPTSSGRSPQIAGRMSTRIGPKSASPAATGRRTNPPVVRVRRRLDVSQPTMRFATSPVFEDLPCRRIRTQPASPQLVRRTSPAMCPPSAIRLDAGLPILVIRHELRSNLGMPAPMRTRRFQQGRVNAAGALEFPLLDRPPG